MQFDIDKMAAMDRYELLLGTVVPRPIALVTTISSDGAINAASGRNDFSSGASRPKIKGHCHQYSGDEGVRH